MKIKWHEVTPFSKWSAIILFIFIVPTLTFYIGRQYESTVEVVSVVQPEVSTPPKPFEALIKELQYRDERYDPVASFIGHAELSPEDHIYKLQADLNGDGYKELLLSSSNWKFNNARAGLVWSVYINNKDKNYYLPFIVDPKVDQSAINLNPGAFGYTTIPGETRKALVSYEGGTLATGGSLVWHSIVNNKLVEQGKHIFPNGADKALYNQLISDGFYNNKIPGVTFEDLTINEALK